MLCALARKKLYVTMLISLLKFSRKIPKLPRLWDGGLRVGLVRSKLDIRAKRGRGGLGSKI